MEPISPPPALYHVIAQQIPRLTLQRRALTHEDISEHLAAFEPFTAPEHEEILDHMLAGDFLIQDGELLMGGRLPSAATEACTSVT